MEILGKLFGSPARVKIMRLFLLNPDRGFETKEVTTRVRVQSARARKEITILSAIGLIQKKNIFREVTDARGKVKKKRIQAWFLKQSFPFIGPLKSFLIDSEFLKKESIATRFRRAGKIKLLVIAGVFIQEPDSRLDILIVGDNLKRKTLDDTVRMLESEVGKDLSYAVFDTKEFSYRVEMYDKLVWDMLDFAHEKVIDNKEFSTQFLKKI